VKPSSRARLAICLLVLLAVSPAFAFQAAQPFSADYSTTSATGNLNMSGKVYFSLPKMRMDITDTGHGPSAGPMGGKMNMIVDGATKTMYMLMPDQHMYMEFSTEQNSPATQSMPKFQDMFRGSDPCAGREGATCKKLGTETVNGRSCDKWEITDKSGKKETFWMDQKLHFPIKMINGDITIQYTNIKEGPQDAALFKVPDGYRKMPMGAGMGRPPR
jgi:outer membrane lipoprotein-sorting protein